METNAITGYSMYSANKMFTARLRNTWLQCRKMFNSEDVAYIHNYVTGPVKINHVFAKDCLISIVYLIKFKL